LVVEAFTEVSLVIVPEAEDRSDIVVVASVEVPDTVRVVIVVVASLEVPVAYRLVVVRFDVLALPMFD
jgi:hypothetical protein